MANIFWNEEERRVRALWRLLLQLMVLVFLVVVLGICLSIPYILLVVGRDGAPPSPEIAVDIQNQPFLFTFNTILTLVAVMLTVWLAGRFLDRRPFADFGFHLNRRWWLDLGFGMALGAVLMGGIFLVERAAGWITVVDTTFTRTGMSFAAAILLQVVIFLAVGIYEEVLTRGYMLKNSAEGLNFPALGARGAIVVAWLLSSLIFGVAHATNPNSSLISTINLIVAGLFLGLGYILTGELAIPIGLHITWNFFQGNVFGFPVSGGTSATSFIAIEQGGPPLWTGGAFGPEAGLIGLAAIAVGSLLTVLWVRWLRDRLALREEIATYSPREAPSPTGEEHEVIAVQ